MSDHPPQLWPLIPEAQLTPSLPMHTLQRLSVNPCPLGPGPARRHGPPAPHTLAQRLPSQLLYSYVVVPLDGLLCSESGSHGGDTTGCLPSIHSHFLFPEALMACAAAESTSPDGCCSCTSPLTEWGLVPLVTKCLRRRLTPCGVQCPPHKPPLGRPRSSTCPSPPWQRAGAIAPPVSEGAGEQTQPEGWGCDFIVRDRRGARLLVPPPPWNLHTGWGFPLLEA